MSSRDVRIVCTRLKFYMSSRDVRMCHGLKFYVSSRDVRIVCPRLMFYMSSRDVRMCPGLKFYVSSRDVRIVCTRLKFYMSSRDVRIMCPGLKFYVSSRDVRIVCPRLNAVSTVLRLRRNRTASDMYKGAGRTDDSHFPAFLKTVLSFSLLCSTHSPRVLHVITLRSAAGRKDLCLTALTRGQPCLWRETAIQASERQ